MGSKSILYRRGWRSIVRLNPSELRRSQHLYWDALSGKNIPYDGILVTDGSSQVFSNAVSHHVIQERGLHRVYVFGFRRINRMVMEARMIYVPIADLRRNALQTREALEQRDWTRLRELHAKLWQNTTRHAN